MDQIDKRASASPPSAKPKHRIPTLADAAAQKIIAARTKRHRAPTNRPAA